MDINNSYLNCYVYKFVYLVLLLSILVVGCSVLTGLHICILSSLGLDNSLIFFNFEYLFLLGNHIIKLFNSSY